MNLNYPEDTAYLLLNEDTSTIDKIKEYYKAQIYYANDIEHIKDVLYELLDLIVLTDLEKEDLVNRIPYSN